MKLQKLQPALLGILLGLSANLSCIDKAYAATLTLNPAITFRVLDGGLVGNIYDGNGDQAFPIIQGPAIKNSEFESSTQAEFDLRSLAIPPGEVITRANLQLKVLGLRLDGQRPTGLVMRGYVGNQLLDASDFEAGEVLATAQISPTPVEEILNWDVTDFINNLISNGEAYAGFGIHAQDFGGVFLGSGLSYPGLPSLTLTTGLPTETIPESASPVALLGLGFCTVTVWLYSRFKKDLQ